jgi:hypothetical protein
LVDDDIKDLIEFANDPTCVGGLQLIFPGVFHDIMVKA